MPPEDVRVDSFMLADAAKAFDGKLYIHGGGWNRLTIYDPASARPITLVGRVIIPKTSAHRDHLLEIQMRVLVEGTIVESQPLVRIGLDPYTSSKELSDVESSTPFVIDIPGVVFGGPGEYEFVVVHDEVEIASSLLHVEFPEPTEVAVVPAERDENDSEQWSEQAREEWARNVLQKHGIDAVRGADEPELDYRQRLIREITQRGYVKWELSPEGSLYLFNAQRRMDPSLSHTLPGSTSVTGAGRTAEEAILMTLAIALDMMDDQARRPDAREDAR